MRLDQHGAATKCSEMEPRLTRGAESEPGEPGGVTDLYLDGSRQERIEQIESRLRELGSASSSDGTDSVLSLNGDITGDDADLAQAKLDQLNSATLARLLAQSRQQLEHALDRLVDGTYGYCEDCGVRIDAERLDFQPEATRCVRCQTRHEQAGSST